MSCQLDLELAVRAAGALREDIEDELRAIDDADRRRLRDVARLRRREVAVEDEQIDPERHRPHEDLLQLALADHRARIDLAPPLQDDVQDFHAGRARQLAQLGHRVLGGGSRTGERAHQDGAAFAPHRATRCGPRHLLLELGGGFLRIEPQLLDRRRLLEAIQLAALVEGEQRRQVDLPRQGVVARNDRGDRVETQQHQVGEVVARERLVLQVRVDEPQAAQAGLARAGAADVGQLDLPRVSDDDVLDFAAPVEQDPNLPARLSRDFRQVARQLRGAQLARLYAAAIGREQAPGLACLQTGRVAVQIVSRTPLLPLRIRRGLSMCTHPGAPESP